LRFEDESDEFGSDDQTALSADVGCPATRERAWIGRLLALAPAAAHHESKIAAVLKLLRRSRAPAIVFTEFRHSLEVIARTVAPLRSVAVLHGGQSPSERREELERFLRHEATVLIASDVAGQGLNLQSAARWVINLELPWNPARLEQRIGRVDRIGQTGRPHFTLLVAGHPAETGVLQRLARRALTAQQSFGHDVLGDLVPPAESAIAAALLDGARDASLRASGEPVAICGTWRRQARASARQIVYRRRLAAHWHAADDGTPLCSSMARAPRLASLACDSLLIFGVPIIDGRGWYVERRIVAVRVPGSAPSPDSRILLRACAAARASLEPRRRRLARLAARHADAAIAVERALAANLDRRQLQRDVQPELFSQAAMRARLSAEQRTQDRSIALRRQLAAARLATQMEIGPATLEIVLVRR
jgi:hypothetical protein